ncbi:hypothetical protein QTP88_019319 [Uroleucon formosanum]
MVSMHRLLRVYVDGISSLKKQGVCAKEKAQVDLVYPMIMWKELERVFNAVRVSQPTVLQLLQALKPNDKLKRLEFSIFMQEAMQDENFASRLVFSNEASFHLSGKVNRHNVRIWGTTNPHAIIEHERDSPKLNVFCAISKILVYGPFFY